MKVNALPHVPTPQRRDDVLHIRIEGSNLDTEPAPDQIIRCPQALQHNYMQRVNIEDSARAKSISPRVFAKSTAVEYSPGLTMAPKAWRRGPRCALGARYCSGT